MAGPRSPPWRHEVRTQELVSGGGVRRNASFLRGQTLGVVAWGGWLCRAKGAVAVTLEDSKGRKVQTERE